MLVVRKKNELKEVLTARKGAGRQIGFVPTMGALHEGHLAMVRAAHRVCTTTVVSIFVNPIQFNNPSDLEKYPRTEEKDAELLSDSGCDILFLPDVDEMYPPGETVPEISLGGLDQVMEGTFRPGHFRGVAIVVKKFFDLVDPDLAWFGKKDFQQLAVIRHMVKTLRLRVRIIPFETVREPDGLAMSSRNVRLSPEDRTSASVIFSTLSWVKSEAGRRDPEVLSAEAIRKLSSVPNARPEYFEIVDAETLQPLSGWIPGRAAIACTAVFLGEVRLIDNMEVFS